LLRLEAWSLEEVRERWNTVFSILTKTLVSEGSKREHVALGFQECDVAKHKRSLSDKQW
jgi:hypothetical protein